MLRLSIAGALTAALLAACSSETAVVPEPPPPPPPALQFGTFDLTHADGQALPALIAGRQISGTIEQVYVDSARLVVLESGRFEQRIWTTTLRDGRLDRRDTWVDGGAWRLKGRDYEFTSTGGSRSLIVRTSVSPVLAVSERMVGWPGAALVAALYGRRSPLPENPPPVGAVLFRATDAGGKPLPSIVLRERDVPDDGAETFTQLDSAWVALRNDGTYERRAYYSTWMSPNVNLGMGYIRVGVTRDYDAGRYARNADGTLALASSYYQNRTATGVHLGDRIRLTQDMTAGDQVKPNVGYTVSVSR